MDVALAPTISNTYYNARTGSPTYRPDIDGLRAVAALAVVASHARFAPGGSSGVDVFFVISGFLISGIIFRELTRNTFSCREFYARRVRRIFPALIVVLVMVWAFGWLMLLPDEYHELGNNISWSAGFMQNFQVYKLVSDHPVLQNSYSRTLLAHVWSLGVEEQFYLLWPITVMATWRLKNGLAVAMSIIAIVSLILSVVDTSWNPNAAYFLPWNRLWELALGGLLAYSQLRRCPLLEALRLRVVEQHPQWIRRACKNVLGITGAVLVAESIAGFTQQSPWWALAPSIGALATISAGPTSWVNRVILSARPLVFVGLISYPLYLWHVPLLWIPHIVASHRFLTPVETAEAMSLTIALAYLTYKYIESPIRASRQKTLYVGGLLLAMVLVGALGYATSSHVIPARSDSPVIAEFIQATKEDWLPDTDNAWTPVTDEFLTIGSNPERTLFIGDNNMQQYFPRVSKIVSTRVKLYNSATFATRAWCPPIAIATASDFSRRFRKGCEEALRKAVVYANRPDVNTVVIAACWHFYFGDFQEAGHPGGSGSLVPESIRAFRELEALIETFVRRGKRVYIVLDNPTGAGVDPHRLIRRTLSPPGFTVVGSPVDRDSVERELFPVTTEIERIAAKTGAKVLNPLNSFCDRTECPVISSDGEPLYHDMFNLRPSFVRERAAFIDESLLSQ